MKVAILSGCEFKLFFPLRKNEKLYVIACECGIEGFAIEMLSVMAL